MTHFADPNADGRTLCGKPWTLIVLRSDPRADCDHCQDIWLDRTGWAFPLPTIVGLETS